LNKQASTEANHLLAGTCKIAAAGEDLVDLGAKPLARGYYFGHRDVGSLPSTREVAESELASCHLHQELNGIFSESILLMPRA